MNGIEEIIKNQPFFEGLSPNNLNIFIACGKKVSFPKDKFIFSTGEHADKFFLIYEGEVSLNVTSISGETISIGTIKKGEILGWSWQFPPYKWSFDAIALSDVNAIEFDVKSFSEKSNMNLVFAYEVQKRFSKVILERLQSTRKKLVEYYEENE